MNKEYIYSRILDLEVEISDLQVEHDKMRKAIHNYVDSFIIAQIADRIDDFRDQIRDKQFILDTMRLSVA
ncbi:hypothetical protein KTR93_001496 [Salmonella enterica]|nr:hypothetical protein [Salmonella enterica]EHT3879720.1 hypothetical protein [Salmonella enterica]EHY6163115.1 hypothetical protein [Salmonella enterica]